MKKDTNFRADLIQLRHNQHFLAISILLLASVLIWVGFEMFKSQKISKITPQQKKLAEPLSPVLDVSVVENLENKIYFSESDLNNFQIYKFVTLDDGELSRAIPIDQDISTLESLRPSPAPVPSTTPTSTSSSPTASDSAQPATPN